MTNEGAVHVYRIPVIVTIIEFHMKCDLVAVCTVCVCFCMCTCVIYNVMMHADGNVILYLLHTLGHS